MPWENKRCHEDMESFCARVSDTMGTSSHVAGDQEMPQEHRFTPPEIDVMCTSSHAIGE